MIGSAQRCTAGSHVFAQSAACRKASAAGFVKGYSRITVVHLRRRRARPGLDPGCAIPGPLVPSPTYEIPAGGPILLPGLVDREADALTAPQLLADPVNRLMGLFTGRLPGS